MSIRVGVNGFGRIGRLVLRCLLDCSNVDVVAVNDLVPSDNLAYLFKYDSTHGIFNGPVDFDEHNLIINGRKIRVCNERDPENLLWKDLGVDYVIESTGLFTSQELAEKHIKAGAKRVIITAPAKGDIPTFVM